MPERKIDQGTIIYGIKSEKYPLVPCYGVIITARCDIAQKKVPKYYYLVAVDATDWFCSEHGYHQAYFETGKNKKQNVCNKASELELDGETLLSMSNESIEKILTDKKSQVQGKRKLEKKIDSLAEAIGQYYQAIQKNSDDMGRRFAIQNDSAPALKCLKEIDAGKLHHYYFLPQDAYLKNGIKSKGLIVDMLEIGILSIADAEKMISPFEPGIYFASLPQLPEIEDLKSCEDSTTMNALLMQIAEYMRLKSSYWLEEEGDFVDIEGTILSPWCEHLMQRFSNVFIRIGLDNPTEQDFESVITHCYMKGNQ
nr:hypothetical protein [uncultured Oscillibacter sp.]